jgi:hypothetical protein
MAAPYFPTPGEQEVLDSLPIPTDDDIPQLLTLPPLPAVPILLATDQVTPLPGSVTADIIESTEQPTGEHPGGYFVEATKLPDNHPVMVIVDQGHPRSLKYVKYGFVNDEPCVLSTDRKGCDIYYTPLHATPQLTTSTHIDKHHRVIDETELGILLEDYIFNIPMNIVVHNLYDLGVCAEVHHLRTITSRLVGMQAAWAYLREFQDLVRIQLNNYNQQVEDLAQWVVQVEKCMVEAKVRS